MPRAAPPSVGNPCTDDFGWILGQFALTERRTATTPPRVDALLVASAPTRLSPPTGDQAVDALLARYGAGG